MKQFRGGYVYMMANETGTKLYTGVTSDLEGRVAAHKSGSRPASYSAINRCYKLVYFRHFPSIELAIEEEKRIKGGSRRRKETLIERMNPARTDLSIGLFD